MKTYKNFFTFLAVLLTVLTLLPATVFAASYPKHENYVADEAGILTETQIAAIFERHADYLKEKFGEDYYNALYGESR